MEEKTAKTAFTLSFQSRHFEQLEVSLCGPEEHVLKAICLNNYQACCFSMALSFSHCYISLSHRDSSSHEVIELELPSEETRATEK